MQLSSVAVVLTVLVTVANSYQCYQCRQARQRSGNRKQFLEKYEQLNRMGWINNCTENPIIVKSEIGCMERSYITKEMCHPKKKCTVKVVESFPIFHNGPPNDDVFYSKPFSEETVRYERPCRHDRCNGDYKKKYVGLKCYHQCGMVIMTGLTQEELDAYDTPVIPCDDKTYSYCPSDMVCGNIEGSAVYRDELLGRDITVEGWYADCFYRDNNSTKHVIDQIQQMMKDYPSLAIKPDGLSKCSTELCNHPDARREA